MFHRILVPLDCSTTAQAILPQVRRILRRERAEVLLMHAVSLPPPPDGHFVTAVPVTVVEDQASAYLDSLVAELREDGITARPVIRAGLAADTILEVAVQEQVSLIAMSTHGYTGASRWIFGSVTEKVLSRSPVPLLVLRSFRTDGVGGAAPVPAEELPIGHILVPVDGSVASREGLPVAAGFAQLFEAQVTLLHVLDPGEERGASESWADATLAEAVKPFREAGLTLRMETRVGQPAVEILGYAEASAVDLIAMSSHGRGGLTRWVFGSTAERVLRGASVPVLLVRNQG